VRRGTETIADTYVRPPAAYGAEGIDVRFARAERVDVPSGRVHLSDGSSIPYGHLVLATGGRPRRPAIPGVELEGVHTLRTIEDADAIREAASSAGNVIVAGMGFIGSEVAAGLRAGGIPVTAIEHARAPLARPLGVDVAAVVEGMHREHGVEMVLGEGVSAIRGNRRAEGVVTTSGRVVDADVVVLGLGTEPNVETVLDTPIDVSNGILVDRFGRTSVPGIYAAGDVANHWHPVARARLRVEHWNNAVKQAKVVALDIVGRGRPYEDVHFFWTEQYDDELKYYGFHQPWDEVIVRGRLADRRFTAFYLDRGRLVAAAGMGRSDELKAAKRIIAERGRPIPAELADEDTDLGSLGLERATSHAA
jgi:3-phenylpropionate/trans-cinnamate dioxygenase ferredoxin reductase subunit